MSFPEKDARVLPRRLPGATVLQIVPALADNRVARAAVDVVAALLQSGARAVIAGNAGPLVGEVQALGGEFVPFASAGINPLKHRENVQRLERLVREDHVDLIHAYGARAALEASAIVERMGVWLVTSYTDAASRARRRAIMSARVRRRSARFIVPSEYAADVIAEHDDIARERLAIVPPRVDLHYFVSDAISTERIMTLRYGWKIRRGERIILVPGRIDPAKGQLMVIDALRILVNGGLHDSVVVFVGDVDDRSEYVRNLKRHVEAQGLGSMTRYPGPCGDMPAAYASAEIVVIPTIEPPTFGRPAAEAMAMGRPVIASSVGALPEIVLAPPRVAAGGRTGWLFAPDDSVGLARAIATVFGLDEKGYQETGARAHGFAVALFSPERVAAATLSVYTSVLAGSA
jgi:glycosyltransferase involved in cell wall biosynthesis